MLSDVSIYATLYQSFLKLKTKRYHSRISLILIHQYYVWKNKYSNLAINAYPSTEHFDGYTPSESNETTCIRPWDFYTLTNRQNHIENAISGA